MKGDPEKVPVAVFGGSGYVAGELLRLLTHHPKFRLAAVYSTSQAGQPVVATFPHLAGTSLDGVAFEDQAGFPRLLRSGVATGLFFATPHGSTAPLVAQVLGEAARAKAPVMAVDLSADFRFQDAAAYERIYGHPHGAPDLLPAFTCAVPEHFRGKPRAHATQPGCFTTSVVLGAWPFFALDLVSPDVFVAAVTGSSGSGRTPAPNTHHPERNGNLYAYNPLVHRHEPEMRGLIESARAGAKADVQFVPHSGPFVRGIHATLRMTLRTPANADELVSRVNEIYSGSPFVTATVAPPKLTEVTGTNRARIGVATRGTTLVVTCVIDNLVKGAAGGAIQWMNRLFDLEDDAGLRLPGLGWS